MEVTGLLSTGTASDPYLGGSSSANLDEPTAAKRRGAAWDGWEDRALTKQVLADDPILSKAYGRREDRWQQVSDNLKQSMGMNRSWISCKDRMEKLVGWHRVSSFLFDICITLISFRCN